MDIFKKLKLYNEAQHLKNGVYSDSEGMVAAGKLFTVLSPFEGFLPAQAVLPYKIIKELVVNGKTHQSNIVELIESLRKKKKEKVIDQIDGHEINVGSSNKPPTAYEPSCPDGFFIDDVKVICHDAKHDIFGWPVTCNITVKQEKGSLIIVPSKRVDWPVWVSPKENHFNASLWVIFKYQEQWYAGTPEWLRLTCWSKDISEISGHKIERDPVQGWIPEAGDDLGVLVTGVMRGPDAGKCKERSNIYWIKL